MAYLSIPLKVVKNGLARENKIKRSIDEALNMLLTTPCYNSIGDSKYGFVFNNMRSKNMNTFAAELKEAVKVYEKRLEEVAVTMTYIREERLVYITIKGVITSTKQDYLYKSTLRVWK